MRRDAEDLRERAQEVERANPGNLRGIVEIDFLVVVRFDPRGGIDCTSAVDRRTHSNVGGFTRQGLADARRAPEVDDRERLVTRERRSNKSLHLDLQ
jgi:hypothetical protein